MVQVFEDISSMQDGILHISGMEYNHIRNVLRMHPGQQLSVRSADESGTGEEYIFEILSFGEDTVVCRLLSVKKNETELPVRVLLFQGLPKGDKMDLIVQKSVEMGVAEIFPVEMQRSVVRLSGDKRRRRADRWQSIAEAAAKQSRRAVIPRVHEPLSMKDALSLAAAEADRILVPYENMAGQRESGTREAIEGLQQGQTAAVFIGPEGGFAGEEIALARESGAEAVSLGRRILRTETAALAFLAFLIYRFEL